MLNICDKNTITNFVNIVFSFLHEQLRQTCSNNFECNYLSYHQENNLFEFSFYVYLSLQDLFHNCNSVFNLDIQQIKELIRNGKHGNNEQHKEDEKYKVDEKYKDEKI